MKQTSVNAGQTNRKKTLTSGSGRKADIYPTARLLFEIHGFDIVI
jgi:hypothetical protein